MYKMVPYRIEKIPRHDTGKGTLGRARESSDAKLGDQGEQGKENSQSQI